MLLTPWERVSCACMAASVAMVIYAHSPCLNEPLCGGSPLGFIRDQSQCHRVAFDSDSQNKYRKMVHHVVNALELGPCLLSTQEAGLSDY